MKTKVIKMSRIELETYILRLKAKETFLFSEIINFIDNENLALMTSELYEVIKNLESKFKEFVSSEDDKILEEVNIDQESKRYH